MSLLDIIANPKIPSALEAIQVMETIRNRQDRNAEYLRKIQLERQKAEDERKALDLIRNRLQPQSAQPTQPATQTAQPEIPQYIKAPTEQQPTQESNIPEYIKAPTEQQPTQQPTQTGGATNVANAIQQVPTDNIAQAKNLTDLTNTLLGMPNVPKTVMDSLLTLRKDAEERAMKQTQAERDRSDQLKANVGNMMNEASKLEEQNKFPEAEALYNQIIDFVSTDPMYKNDPDIKKFTETHKQYQPGFAKIMYFGTEYGSKARDQYQSYLRDIESARHNLATENQAYQNASETQRHNSAMELEAQEKTVIQRNKARADNKIKTADASLIYRMAVGFHGGLFDEQGNPKFIDPKKTQDIQDLSELASIIWARGKAETPNEAISKAAKQLDMEMTKPEGGPAQPITKPKVDITNIPKAHIDALKANPDQASDFDKLYGKGTAKAILGD